MPKRGLLDFIISRLKGVTLADKITLCKNLQEETDLTHISMSGLALILGKKIDINIEDAVRGAEIDAQAAMKRGIQWVSWHDAEYPPLLREIYDPPVMLFYKGCLPNPDLPLVAIVGTRKPSPQAARQAFDIARGLGRSGISVVSGLALGIDAMAHRGNLESGVPGVAVLGSGIDEIYPSINRNLARRLIENGGALLSEYPPGTIPQRWTFPARNRIISGMARGVLIVEAPKKSGALITAAFALDQNKELWVSSTGSFSINEKNPSWFDRRGTALLAEDGAGVIHEASDILKEWNLKCVRIVNDS
ncbi:MAG: DNA-processing protein DprA [Treponema sp.]|nr:DNA-processing protein DprA [Treponema sp.]